MYVFGHTGIAAGLAYLGQYFSKSRSLWNARPDSPVIYAEESGRQRPRPWYRGGATGGAGLVDFRIIVVGVMLPDIIDKPLGPWTFNTGRMIGHTLFLNLLLLTIGVIILSGWGRVGFLTFALASTLHLIQDAMWSDPEVLLWPLYGWRFPETGVAAVADRLHELTHNPGIYVPELVGGVMLAVFFLRVWTEREWQACLRWGTLR